MLVAASDDRAHLGEAFDRRQDHRAQLRMLLLGISVGNLHDDAAVQLALPFDRRRSGADGLDAAVDEVRDRFGSTAVTRAVLLGRDHHPSVPLLPD